MACHLNNLRSTVARASTTVRPSPRALLRCAATPQGKQAAGSNWHHQIAAGALAAALFLQTPEHVQAAEIRSLADLTRSEFSFVDQNKDGVISLEEMAGLARQVAQEEEFDEPGPELLAFSQRMFDLNQDGTTTTDEMLTSLALSNAVSEETGEVDTDAIKMFDKDGDGLIMRRDWSPPFGDMGVSGNELKNYTFDRVDFLSGPEGPDGKLSVQEIGQALTLMRTQVMGY